MYFKICPAKDGQFYFVLMAKNGRVIMTSETYKKHWGAIIAMRKVSKATGIQYSSK